MPQFRTHADDAQQFNAEWAEVVGVIMDAEALADPNGIIEVEPIDDVM